MNKIKIINTRSYKKKSGTLIPLDLKEKFSTEIKRIFYIYGKKNYYRGDHAHKKCKQIFIPIYGKIELVMENKNNKRKIILNSKKIKAVYVPNLTWCSLKFLTKNAIIMVLCDRKYEFSDYIDNYLQFKKMKKN